MHVVAVASAMLLPWHRGSSIAAGLHREQGKTRMYAGQGRRVVCIRHSMWVLAA